MGVAAGRAAAMLTQADSKPAAAGRVPSMGALQATVLRVIGPARQAGAHVLLEVAFGDRVDLEGHIAADGLAGVGSGGVQPEERLHDLA